MLQHINYPSKCHARSLPERWREKVIVNFHIDVYKCIVHDRLEKLKKETYEYQCYEQKTGSIVWKINKNLFLQWRKAK